MKHLILIIALMTATQCIQAQESPSDYNKEWLNAEGEILPEKRLAKYYQKIYTDGKFERYDLSDRKIMSGYYISKTDRKYHGEISYYNRGGDLIKVEEYDKGRLLEFPMTTMDIKQDYHIVGLVSASYESFDVNTTGRGSFTYAIQKCKAALIKECKEKGGDAIIGLRIEQQNPQKDSEGNIDGTITMYGTAVLLK